MFTSIANNLLTSINIRGSELTFFAHSGKVIGKDQSIHTHTTVTGGGARFAGNVAVINDTTATTSSYSQDEFWLKDGESKPKLISAFNHKIMEGHYVTAVYVSNKELETGTLVAIQNHSEGKITQFDPMDKALNNGYIDRASETLAGILFYLLSIISLFTFHFVNEYGFEPYVFFAYFVVSSLFVKLYKESKYGKIEDQGNELEQHIAKISKNIDDEFWKLQKELEQQNEIANKDEVVLSMSNELEKLQKLKESKVINEEEFNLLKQNVMNKVS
ncbi:hypothetical protein [Psychrosphaera haliotis]|uniref:SHOCT domain-containing protein n=1 Tax=Psychrosphaera haliotis TaxID=555083 RepID=A0A6N8FDJ0_9GAMM|nr:hypothetical protein [Psychrosphaera haliotis]MUH72792.1 hypothetical protein [Psychrosphaera haliotis]